MKRLLFMILLIAVSASSQDKASPETNNNKNSDHISLPEREGPGKGKHIVLLAGDEEYRSEEALPMLAQVLNQHGFKCTVLFSIDKKSGLVDPNNQKSLSNPSALDTADLLIMSLRFRNWNDSTMQKFENALLRGVPLIGLRTTTHAFKFPKNSKWFKYSTNASKASGWHRGFGREIMGETWVNHHGRHKVEGTRSFIEEANKAHEILNGVGTIFGTTDVYGARPDMSKCKVLLRGGVTKTLKPDSALVEGRKNNPMQPIAWIRNYKHSNGKSNKVFTTTMGSSRDLLSESLRRIVVNAAYWGLDMKIPKKANVDIPGDYQPTEYSFRRNKMGKKPVDYLVKPKSEK